MIYNDNFIWLHFPKCAGTKIENLFRKYFSDKQNLFQDPVGVNVDPSIAWHDSISDRIGRDPEFEIGDRIIITSFRRLTSWLISRYNFEVERNPNFKHRPELLFEGKFLEANGNENHADNYAKKYLPKKIIESGKVKFLRTEYFESDFKFLFREYVDLSNIPAQEFTQKINASRNYVPKNIINYLHSNEKIIYDNCPYWSGVEKMAYDKK